MSSYIPYKYKQIYIIQHLVLRFFVFVIKQIVQRNYEYLKKVVSVFLKNKLMTNIYKKWCPYSWKKKLMTNILKKWCPYSWKKN